MSAEFDKKVATEVAELVHARGDGDRIEFLDLGDGEFKVWLKDRGGDVYHQGYYKVVPALIRQRFKVGDIVRFHDGKVDWEVAVVVNHDIDPSSQYDWHYILKSGMSGRRVTAFETDIRPWVPHE